MNVFKNVIILSQTLLVVHSKVDMYSISVLACLTIKDV